MAKLNIGAVYRFALSGILLLVISACDSDGDAQRLSNLVVAADENFLSLQIDEDTAPIISVNESENFVVSALTEDGLSSELDGVFWSSSNAAIASVSSAGVVTGGTTPGRVDITANFGNLTARRSIRVSDAPLSRVEVLFNSAVLAGPLLVDECSAVQFSAQGIYLGEEDEPRDITDRVIWEVSPLNAVFDPVENGLLRTRATDQLIVNANFEQETGMQVVDVDSNLVSITVSPDLEDGELNLGNPVQYRAVAGYRDEMALTQITDNVEWRVTDGAQSVFANVDNILPGKGTVTPISVGEGTLTASCAEVIGQIMISSGTGGLIDSVEIDGEDITIILPAIGFTTERQLTANGLFNLEFERDVTEESDWLVLSGNDIVTVSNASGSRGLLTVSGTGTAVVQVVFPDGVDGDEEDTVRINVQ